MAIDVKLSHLTRYRYSKPVIMGPQVVRLRPAPHCRTKIISYSFQVKPENNWVNWQQDAFSNHLARLVFPDPIKLFEISVDLVAHMEAYNPFDFFLEESAENYPFAYEENEAEDLKPYLRKSEMGPLLKKWVDAVDRSEKRVIDFLVELNQKINGDLGYLIRMEPGVQTPEETLEKGCGSCRDFAWLFVNILRQLGLAARFVSGYSIQLKADVKALDGPSGVESDVCDLHAWTEVYLPGAGWVGMDATSGLFCGEGHLPLACTPEPRTAAAITGGFNAPDDMEDDFHFEMSVKRVFETPRVTLPYSDEQWSAINALGKKIDKRLRRSDVRLTMGGEPTFVSIDDFESPQWTTDAFGKEKSERSDMLMKMLFEKYGQGGFLHYGQGKWYPGEQLPRWAYSCLWRKDGQRIWNEPELFADVKTDYGFNEHDAENFMAGLIGKLGIDSKFVMNGYEDAWYYMWKERRLPSNVHLHNNKLDDPHERERLAKVFEQGVSKKVGYALPIERGWKNGVYSWVSGPWFLRPEEMFLIPGDSAMGLRLPMDSIPWTASSDLRFLSESSVPEDVPPLPEYDKIAQQYFRVDGERRMEPWKEYMRSFGQGVGKMPPHMRPRPEKMKQPDVTPQLEESAPWIVKTAMCVEPRNGKLHIFMPPVYSMEDYIDLLTALEATATEQDRPIVIEGYLPPYDPRMDYVKITPDPGVIEVNVQPSHSWDHLVEKTKFLYDAARECRLGTEKFDVDGSHTGTGGGNHIVVGGEHPTSSPFLRRPKLLSSLVAYWHNHPSLSYLFSGKFIGPTSQAPRIDEARNDSLYEMEIAFNELNRQLDINNCPPWLVDRIFRNLLIDVTGNTHRAEFCIDKLYSPDSNTGRLGLLEQRAYEMPPHSEMSLTQHLLLRGLIARFWDDPYEPDRLARWGTQLHDRWMLPHFVMNDMTDICEDMDQWGMPFDTNWFAPHYDFRYPKYGEVDYRGMSLELRQALEPWHVLGESAAEGGTVRYVDSSVERVQVKLSGLVKERYALACNGYRVPLTPTGVEGEYVAGVRYRAWQPPTALHPTIPIHSPLRFDLVDQWNNCSIGGCRYHVKHPGGRGYEDFPVNALAAESRRLSRFESMGHSPGALAVEMRDKQSVEFPMTLDLREPVKSFNWTS